MTHFLARLVERARGTAPRVEPIVAPRFAPAPTTEVATEFEAPASVASRPDEMAQRNKPAADKLVRQENKPHRAEESRHGGRAAPEPENLLVPKAILVAPSQTSVVRRLDPEDVIFPPRSNGARPKQSAAQATPTRPGSPPPATTGRREVVAGGVDPGHIERLRISPNEPANERPIVRVTIGRIDVRAAPAPSAPARKPAPRSEPKLTLDAYLKSRQEGAR